MYFDTHAHYDDSKFNQDRDAVINGLHDSGVDMIINPGCDISSSKYALRLADSYPFIYAAVGIHPEELPDNPEEALTELKALIPHNKCVAIGEIGLDYYWDTSKKDIQKLLFIKQLELAAEKNLPVIVHDREAHGDCLTIVKAFPDIRGVFHCYSGSCETAEELLKLGWYLGFDGPITYKNARKSIEVLEMCPMDRVLIETDSPYLPPVPNRGKRNDSGNLKYIVEKIAEIKQISTDEVCEITSHNGKTLFNIR